MGLLNVGKPHRLFIVLCLTSGHSVHVLDVREVESGDVPRLV